MATISLVGAAVTGTNATTLTINPTAIGNAFALFVKVNSNTATVSSVSSSGTTGWTRIAGPTVDTNATPHTHEIWLGRVTATGSQTLTVANSGGTGMALDAQQASSTAGAGTIWGKDGTQSGFKTNTSSKTVTLPTLTPSGTGWYFGHGRCPTSSTYSAPAAGYTLTTDANGNPLMSNPAASGAQSPTLTQVTAQITYAIGVIIAATVATGILKVRRSAAWTAGAVKVRRSAAWVAPTAVKVRRGGAWTAVT